MESILCLRLDLLDCSWPNPVEVSENADNNTANKDLVDTIATHRELNGNNAKGGATFDNLVFFYFIWNLRGNSHYVQQLTSQHLQSQQQLLSS